jgi:putative transcriptional regulator
MSKPHTFATGSRDPAVAEPQPAGAACPLIEKSDWEHLRAMTDEEVTAAAMADPDARPMTPEQLENAKRVPRIRTLRRALRLTQEEFAAQYHIPVGTLRDWEQGRTEPDQPARAYLTVIAADPEGVSRRLATSLRSRA